MAPPKLTPEQLEASKQRRRQKEAERRRLLRQDPAFRARERERNAAARREARRDEKYRQREREREARARRRARQDPEYRRREQQRNTEAKRRARGDPAYGQLKRYLAKEGTKEAAWLSGFALGYVQKAWTSIRENGSKGSGNLPAKNGCVEEVKCSQRLFTSPCPSVTEVHEAPEGSNSPNRKQTEDRPFRCDLCSAAFVKAVGLKCHMRVHSTDRLFACDLCPVAFKHATSLAKHRRSHTLDGEFKCSICFCTFGRQSNLTRHTRHHTEGMAPRDSDSATADGRASPELISPDGPPLCMDTVEVDSVEVVQCTPELASAESSTVTGSDQEEAAETNRNSLEANGCDGRAGGAKAKLVDDPISPPPHHFVQKEEIGEELITPEVITSETVPSATVGTNQTIQMEERRIVLPEDASAIDTSVSWEEVPEAQNEPSAGQSAREVDTADDLRHSSNILDEITPDAISPCATESNSVHLVPVDALVVKSSVAEFGPVATEQSGLCKWKRTLEMKCVQNV